MPTRARAVLAGVIAVFAPGCATSPPRSSEPTALASPPPIEPVPCGDRVEGSPADYAPPAPLPEGIVVAEPKACPNNEAYIRIERTIGARRLGIARDPHGGGFNEGCMTLPLDPLDRSQCPVINPSPILRQAGERLQAARVKGAGGSGLGPCGDLRADDYAAWNFAVGVVEWKDAAAAVEAVSELLAAYDVKGYVGVSVRGIICAHFD